MSRGIAADGAVDTYMVSGMSGDGSDEVRAMVALPDGKVLIGGYFNQVDGQYSKGIARLNVDGSRDAGFLNLFAGGATSVSGVVEAIATLPTGEILIGGSISIGSGQGFRARLLKLDADGSIDFDFDLDTPDDDIKAIVVQPGGRILIGGEFDSVGGTPRNYIARLNADGSLDPSFNPGAGANGRVECIALLPEDGKILICGSFTEYDGTPRSRIAQLNADGSLDTDFDPGSGADSRIARLVLQSDGKIVIGGQFTAFADTSRIYIARLNADGSLDMSFDPGNGPNGLVRSVAVQSDGKVLIGDDFVRVRGTARSGIARMNADGTHDTGFDPGTGMTSGNGVFPGWVSAMALQAGKVVVGGSFNEVNGQRRDNIARLAAAAAIAAPGPEPLEFEVAFTSASSGTITVETEAGATYTLKRSATLDRATAEVVSTQTGTGAAMPFVFSPPSPTPPQMYYWVERN